MAGVKNKKLAAALLTAVFLAALIIIYAFSMWDGIFYQVGYRENINDESSMTAAFLNVGTADCCVLSCGGKTVMIDSGDSLGKGGAEHYLKKNKIDKIDLVVLSHFDVDHCGELENIISETEISRVAASGAFENSDSRSDLLRLLIDRGIRVEYKDAGDVIEVGKMKITVLSPHGNEFKSENDNSLVCMVQSLGRSVLFTGDAGEAAEEALVKDGTELKCDILKVSHHGSGTGTGKELIESAKPEYAVVSVGANNYGLPSYHTLESLERSETKVLRTDKSGNIIFNLSRQGISVKTEY